MASIRRWPWDGSDCGREEGESGSGYEGGRGERLLGCTSRFVVYSSLFLCLLPPVRGEEPGPCAVGGEGTATAGGVVVGGRRSVAAFEGGICVAMVAAW